jgi:hypothetical protein
MVAVAVAVAAQGEVAQVVQAVVPTILLPCTSRMATELGGASAVTEVRLGHAHLFLIRLALNHEVNPKKPWMRKY